MADKITASLIHPPTGQKAWFTFPIYFGKLSQIGHSGSYDELVEVRQIIGTNDFAIGYKNLHELEKLNRLAEKL